MITLLFVGSWDALRYGKTTDTGLGSFNSILFSALTVSLRSNRLKIEEKGHAK